MNKIYSSDNPVANAFGEMGVEVEKWNIEAYNKTFMDLKSYGQSVFDENINRKVYAAYDALIYYNCDKESSEKSILIGHELERLKMRLFG